MMTKEQRSRNARKRGQQRRKNRRPMTMECLESRQMMAADMLGVVRDGHDWYLNTDGDQEHEIEIGFGLSGDLLYASGDFNGNGRQNPVVVRKHANGGLEWYFDADGDKDAEQRAFFGLSSFIPVIGDFNGDGKTDIAAIGPESVVDPTVGLPVLKWHISYAPFQADSKGFLAVEGTRIAGFQGDRPVVGDWDGDGDDDTGVVSQVPTSEGLQRWYLNTNSGIRTVDFGFFGDRPVVGDWDGDGDDNPGVVTADANRDGKPEALLTWFLDTDGDKWPEISRTYGFPTDIPVVGRWSFPEITLLHNSSEIFTGQQIDLGKMEVGQTVTRTLVVRNDGTVPLTLNSSISGSGFKLTKSPASSLNAGRTTELGFSFTAPSAGSHKGSVVLTSNDPNESRFEIRVAASVTTVPPADITPPVVSLSAANVTQPGTASHSFRVTVTDNVAVKHASLDHRDIVVQGPQGQAISATLVAVDKPGDGTPRVATYRIAAPGGTWNVADNGVYTVNLAANQICDTSGNCAAGKKLGEFRATLPTPALSVRVSPDSMSEAGGKATGTVTRANDDTSSAVPVKLTSSDTTEAKVPASVTIEVGKTSANFTITAVDDTILDGTQTVTITATANGYTSDDAIILVEDNEQPTGEIRGVIWHDRNANRQKDSNEPILSNWQVFLDTNNNGKLDSQEPVTKTNSAGAYVFSNLQPGAYTVAQVLPAGWLQTFPNASFTGEVTQTVDLTTTASLAVGSVAASEMVSVDQPMPAQDGIATDRSLDLINLDRMRADSRFASLDGRNFAAVIIDSGIDTDHSFFGPDGNRDGVADRIVFQYDFSGTGDADANDTIGHGTHVSGIIGSQDSRYPGVAPGVNLIHLKVFSDYSNEFWFRDLEKALKWVVENTKRFNIASVNMSLGNFANYAQPLQDKVKGIDDELAKLAEQNVIVVSAAGNSYFNFGSQVGVSYPAADPNSLAISSVWDAAVPGPVLWGSGAIDWTTGSDRVVSHSQRHPNMTDVFAPGAAITSAYLQNTTAALGGTSMAAPHVAGAAALAQQLAAQHLGRRLTMGEFRGLLQYSGATIRDGDDEHTNVRPTNLDFKRLDMLRLAEGILALKACSHTAVVTAGKVSKADFGNTKYVVSQSPLHASGVVEGDAEALDPAELYRVAAAAIERWQQTGISSIDTALLASLSYQVADLPGDAVSQTEGTVITLDTQAAGRGWFVDATPRKDEEFAGDGSQMSARDAELANGRIDLMSVLAREMAHILDGELDSGDGQAMLATSVRQLPEAALPQPNRRDANRDGRVTPLDALQVINVINQTPVVQSVAAQLLTIHPLDVNRDSHLTPQDVLEVISFLNWQAEGELTGEGENPAPTPMDQQIAVPPTAMDANSVAWTSPLHSVEFAVEPKREPLLVSDQAWNCDETIDASLTFPLPTAAAEDHEREQAQLLSLHEAPSAELEDILGEIVPDIARTWGR